MKGMESPHYEMTHDFKEENRIAERNFRCGYLKGYHDAIIKTQEQIVRCKDCKHRDPENGECDSGHGIQWQLPRSDDWFCADGERKEGR